MKPYRLHVFVCQGKRCLAKGSEGILEEIKGRVKAEGVKDVKVSRSGCMKACKDTDIKGEHSPFIVVYPEGVWYGNVNGAALDEIMESHIKKGEVVERLVYFRLGGAGAGEKTT
ncbi:MAG: ferredoxin [Thermodesulfobacteriota bacterium]